MRARVKSSGTGASVRLLYEVGELLAPTEKPRWPVPADGLFHIADLGNITLQPRPTGDHAWQGLVQATGTGSERVTIDKLWLIPLDEFATTATTPNSTPQSLTGPSALATFPTPGALAGTSATIGGRWAEAGGSADSFAVGGGVVSHAGSRDASTSLISGKVASIGALVLDDMIATLYGDGAWNIATDVITGLAVRYVDSNNFLAVYLTSNTVPFSVCDVVIAKRVAGVDTVLGTLSQGWTLSNPQITAIVSSGGVVQASLAPSGTYMPALQIARQDSDLAVGGPLARGTVGVIDRKSNSRNGIRRITAAPYIENVVMIAGQSVQLRTDGHIRFNGRRALPLTGADGNLPRLPSGTVEAFVKNTRSDLANVADSGLDGLSYQVFYRPCWTSVPT